MSKSLAILNGDLVISNRSFQSVSGQDKLLQDLKCWILERVGIDSATPSYGTRLTADYDDNGFIGGIITEQIASDVRAEVRNMLVRYQTLQLQKIESEMAVYDGQTTLSPEEIISDIGQITTAAIGTLIVCRVDLTTLAGQDLRLTLPVGI